MTTEELQTTTERLAQLLAISGGRYHTGEKAIRKLQMKIAREYGRRNGWELWDRRFTLEELTVRQCRRGARRFVTDDSLLSHRLVEHGYFFRDKLKRPTAIAAHLYDIPGGLESLAELIGLSVTFPTNFPSWHFPGRTTLTLYRPLTEASHG